MNRFRISESERNNILNLHKNYILNEQGSVSSAPPANYTITQLQELLNQKGYNVGTADGNAGPKTLAGLQQALAAVAKNVPPPQLTQSSQQVTTPAQTATQVNVPATNLGFNPSALGGTPEVKSGQLADKSGEKPKADDAVDSRNV